MSLHLRIFLSFWLAMLLLAGSFFVLQRIYGDELVEKADAVVQAKAEAASVLWQEGGLTAVQKWLEDTRDNRRHALVDKEGNPQLRKALPRSLRRVLPRDIEPGIKRLDRGHILLAARLPQVTPELYLVTDLHRGRLGRMPLWLRAIVAALVFGLVSLGLAHLLTRRVRPLRLAAQRLAEGDLSVRVDHKGTDEISALGADFNRMAERLNDLLQSQRRLVRDVSHELRSPLARLRIALELAERADDPRQALKQIEKEADELERLTTEVLSLARLESGQAMFERHTLRLDELVAKVVKDADFEAGANAKRIHFSPEPMEVDGDPVLLRSAVENVVRNAIRHTADRSGILVTMTKEDGQGVIRVCDAGPGLAESQLQVIFDPFSRTAESRDRSSGGFGLGLAIARRAMRAHGGDIEASNRPEGGLEVTLHLPLSAG